MRGRGGLIVRRGNVVAVEVRRGRGGLMIRGGEAYGIEAAEAVEIGIMMTGIEIVQGIARMTIIVLGVEDDSMAEPVFRAVKLSLNRNVTRTRHAFSSIQVDCP